MNLDRDLLERFEAGLNPQRIEASAVPARLIGYGEISAIFQIRDDTTVAYKRMPLFDSPERAAAYADLYREYSHLLDQAGLHLPDSATAIVAIPARPVVLYIGQRAFAPQRVAHKLIHELTFEQNRNLIRRIMDHQAGIWAFNQSVLPELEIAVDSQISNWVVEGDIQAGTIYYLDTSTPFIRKQGRHQLDPELLLQAAPVFIRWLLRWLFVGDVLNRYYDPRRNMIDLAANLYKEQRPDLIPVAIDTINESLPRGVRPLNRRDVEKYYREDKFIWSLFLTLRRLDRFMITRIFRRRYEFILPGKIKR
ncbi:MAG: hypothetical protein JJV98_09490 [Desulfosarcina sp.]|nr:hypothetical protein [Desulfobacterales bacterium]